MKRYWILCIALLGLGTFASAQELDPTCVAEGVSEDNLLFNGDFEATPNPPSPPTNWTPLLISPQLVLGDPVLNNEGVTVPNHYVRFPQNGAQMRQPVRQDTSSSTRYRLKFCGFVNGGQIIVESIRGEIMRFPETPGVITDTAISEPFFADFGSSSSATRGDIWIRFEGNGEAIIDNVELLPFTGGGNEEPTATPPMPTSTPTPPPENTPANTATPMAPLAPGTPTPTPTPQFSSQSLRIIPNPPMIVVSPDDFTNPRGAVSQIELNLDVVGIDGNPINILALDEDAQIEFQIDARGETENVAVIRGFEQGSNSDNIITNQQRDLSEFVDNGEFTLYFVPLKPYDGVVRIVADLDFEGRGNEGQVLRKELRAVVPIVMRTDPGASLTNTSGSFSPAANFRMGRQPGDRGFRPDLSTNLYFRERIEQ